MKKLALLLSPLLIIAFLLGGCGSTEDSSARKISVTLPNNSDRWRTSGADIKQRLEELHYQVELQNTNSADEQNNFIRSEIAAGSNCLVIGAVDSTALVESLSQAKENNIPVIAYDRLIMDTDALSYYATFDNYGIGSAMGKYIEAHFNLKSGAGPFTAEIFSGSDDDNNAVLVRQGFMDVLQPYLSNAQLIVPSSETDFKATSIKSWSTDKAEQRMNNLLSKYYNSGQQLDIIISSADCLSVGIIKALNSGYQGNWPFITGQDADAEMLDYIKTGQAGHTIQKSSHLMNTKVIKMIKAVVEGSQPEINDNTTYNNNAITVPSYLCIPLIIDKDNIANMTE